MDRPKVVILGAGFAGLAAARELRKAPVEVTLVDRHNFQTFQPLLYQVATAGLNPADVAFPVRGILRRYSNARFRCAAAVGVDHYACLVQLDDGAELPFDYLVVAGGARAAFFGVAGAEEHAFSLYALNDATRLRNHVLQCFEAADADPDAVAAGALTFAVVGAGPTGVEMAGALVEMIDGILKKDYPLVDAAYARVVLIEMRDVVLAPFHPRSRKHALDALGARGIGVRFDVKVEEIMADGVRLASGDTIPTRTVVWAAGVQAAAVASLAGGERGEGERVVVGQDLSVPGRPDVFIAGDMAAATGPDGELLPQIGPVAIQEGRHAAQQIVLRMRDRPTQPFVFRSKGVMATIGRRSAVAELPSGLRLSGTIGWLAWLFLHLLLLVGFRNKLSVLLNWGWSYVVRERGPRLILEPEPRPPNTPAM